MKVVINPAWMKDRKEELEKKKIIDLTISYTPALKWLIEVLSNKNIFFKLYNLGAGVKRITTDTAVCPCCKKKL